MWFGESVGWGVGSDVGYGVASADGSKFGIEERPNLGSSDYSLDDLNYGNHVG